MAPSLKMSKAEREEFLAGQHVGVIAIDAIEAAGRAPLTAPIWYDYTPEQGVWIVTGKKSRKGVALDAAGRFSLVAQQEAMPYKYVSVEGPISDARPAGLEEHRRPMAWRYFGEEFGNAYVEGGSDGVEGGSDEEENWVYFMRPERWLTVDYAKMLPGS